MLQIEVFECCKLKCLSTYFGFFNLCDYLCF
ncbi:hypothetical protein F383_34118 [Gossypium arboreum]|uniref:Uncharacterized protein n=1 Tax=Gossypium arboreum TaxID=29729 RepID=A0A0B0PRB5_GOSAR|nr:hypothetical protein F383_34118 [Gossypium arboreum]